MKQPKKLTRNQKELLVKRGYDPEDVKSMRFVEEDDVAILVTNLITGEYNWVEKKRR